MASRSSLGIIVTALGVAIPIIAYLAGNIFVSEVASSGGPPNQGAMVLAYLVTRGALAVGGCLALIGVTLILRGLK